MRKLAVLLLIFVPVLIFSQCPGIVRYRVKYLPDSLPKVLSDVYELDTVLTGYWTLPVEDSVIYPTLVGYRVQPDMGSYTDWPSVQDALDRSYHYFTKHPDAVIYRDRYVKVFVSKK